MRTFLMLWKYFPLRTSERDGQQMGVWMKKFVAIVPSSTISFLVFGSGVAPPDDSIGKDPPSIWSWSSVRNPVAEHSVHELRSGLEVGRCRLDASEVHSAVLTHNVRVRRGSARRSHDTQAQRCDH